MVVAGRTGAWDGNGSLSGALLLRAPLRSAGLANKEVWGWVCSENPRLTSGPTLQDSVKKFERELLLERHLTLLKEKQVILKRQQEEVSRLMQRQVCELPRQADTRPPGRSG